MGFRKNYYQIGRHIDRFGKNIIITDRSDWETDEMVVSRVFRTFFDVATRLWFWHDMEPARALRLGRIATIPAVQGP
jgi:hypothetical protein